MKDGQMRIKYMKIRRVLCMYVLMDVLYLDTDVQHAGGEEEECSGLRHGKPHDTNARRTRDFVCRDVFEKNNN